MSDESKNSSGWINNVATVWKQDSKKFPFALSIPLAEPVTLKIQRKVSGGGFAVEEVTLIPETNDKGYSSVRLPLQKPRATEKYNPPEKLKYIACVPPDASGDGESDF